MPTPITIARAAAADLPAVVNLCLLVEAQHESYNPVRWKTRPGLHAGYLGWLTRHLDDPHMLILAARPPDDPGHIVGALLAAIETEIPIYVYKEYAFIHDLAVAESFRHQGIARQMLEQTRQWAAALGMTQLRLMVASQNPSAQALFQALGFQLTYQEMILPLTPPSPPLT